MSQRVNSGQSLAAAGSTGDAYTYTVPNTSTDSIVSAWATRDADTGDLGLSPFGVRNMYEPTSFGVGANGEITSVTFENLTDNYGIDIHVNIIYITPRP